MEPNDQSEGLECLSRCYRATGVMLLLREHLVPACFPSPILQCLHSAVINMTEREQGALDKKIRHFEEFTHM